MHLGPEGGSDHSGEYQFFLDDASSFADPVVLPSVEVSSEHVGKPIIHPCAAFL
jgi:hypothetical protein